jgi:hypothetical protein
VDRDLIVGHHYAVDEQFEKVSLAVKIGIGQAVPDPVTKSFSIGSKLRNLPATESLLSELLLLPL